MQLSSPVFASNGSIPPLYTCDGKGISPPLAISGVPAGAKSLALLVEDPDLPPTAPVKVWDHWVAFNIPPTVTEIPEATQPPGTPGKNTRGALAYGGPCPPDREHRYFFTLYALDVMLDLSSGATKADVEKAMDGHIVEQAELVGRYARQK